MQRGLWPRRAGHRGEAGARLTAPPPGLDCILRMSREAPDRPPALPFSISTSFATREALDLWAPCGHGLLPEVQHSCGTRSGGPGAHRCWRELVPEEAEGGAPAYLHEEPPTASLQNPALGGAALSRPGDLKSQSPCRAAPGAGDPVPASVPSLGGGGAGLSQEEVLEGPHLHPGHHRLSLPSLGHRAAAETHRLQPLPHT